MHKNKSSKKASKPEFQTIAVRIPSGIYDKFSKMASDQRRSMSGQALHMIEQGLREI